VAIVVEYDNTSLFLMLLKSYHHLHPLSKVESSFVNIREKYYSLDIFEMIININECMKELVNQELLIFQRYQIDVKISNALSSGGRSIIPYFQLLIFWFNKYMYYWISY
jgi:hypothetical protein